MAVNPADVQVGRCFITTGGQVRQVTEIANGTVHCQVRGGKWKGKEDTVALLCPSLRRSPDSLRT